MAISFYILNSEIEFYSLTSKFLWPIIQLKFILFYEERFQISLWKAFIIHQLETSFRSLLSVFLLIESHHHPIYYVLKHLNLILNFQYPKWLGELAFKIEIFLLSLLMLAVFLEHQEYLAHLLPLMVRGVVLFGLAIWIWFQIL
jgi:hypothetical protein